jgi:hypothetical protein
MKKGKRTFEFMFMPGDKVYMKLDKAKTIGVVDTCAISHNPEPRYWVIFPPIPGTWQARNVSWFMESLLSKSEIKE